MAAALQFGAAARDPNIRSAPRLILDRSATLVASPTQIGGLLMKKSLLMVGMLGLWLVSLLACSAKTEKGAAEEKVPAAAAQPTPAAQGPVEQDPPRPPSEGSEDSEARTDDSEPVG
jgi:hypothetical protein